MKKVLIRSLVLAVGFAGVSLAFSVSPAAAQPTSETIALCSVNNTGPAGMQLNCVADVGDGNPGVGPDPTGTVVFFLNAISSNAFIGQCTLNPLPGPGGLSKCSAFTSAIPAAPATIWAVYFPAAGSPYDISVDSDDVTNVATAPPDPTDTKILCVPTGPAGVAQPLECAGMVADDDGDPSPAPTGTVGFFLNSISTSAFLAQCQLGPISIGLSECVTPPGSVQTSPVGPGPVTIWGSYFPNTGAYTGSVDNDQLTV
jgi:hypothetical protein